jgi:site-specific recombinase XerD
MVEIIRKGALPRPEEVPAGLRAAAAAALKMTLREPRPAGFPLLFSSDLQLIEPAVAFLHEHAIQRAHTADTLRTYMEILYDWFDALEQSGILWSEADTADLVAYRNRMLKQPSAHTGRAYSVRTINHRVRGVLRFYEWAVRNAWLRASPLVGRANDLSLARRDRGSRRRHADDADRSFFVLRQFESLPRPLTSPQARDLLAELPPPYDLMARWQLYTGLRVSELLRLSVKDIVKHGASRRSSAGPGHRVIDVLRKGRKHGYVIASMSLLEETAAYLAQYRTAWLKRAARKRRASPPSELFINRRGSAVKKNTYQQVIHRAGEACSFKAAPHLLRATFGCMMLARLEQLAKRGAAINPLLIVKILMAHEHIETTDKYLRAVAIDTHVLADVLETLIAGKHRR